MRGPSSQLAHKQAALEPILKAFPRRKFILIGDSGEQDPLIYGNFLRHRPQQVTGVFIRALNGETVENTRLQAAFADCDRQKWHVFQSPAEIQPEIFRHLA